jgi:predicted phosphoribosyltransferase
MVDQQKTFEDRTHAGIVLARMLDNYRDEDVLVLGIPRGGVIVACEVAKYLNGALSVIITKKLPHPLEEEMAIGAVAEDGSVFLTMFGQQMEPTTVDDIIETQSKEIKSRIRRFRKGKPLPDMKNKTVIIVDDGIATGSTIVPAITLCKSRKAAKVVVASPVSGERYVSEINTLADEVVVAEQPDDFNSVGQAYDDFHHLTDEEVLRCLSDFEKRS